MSNQIAFPSTQNPFSLYDFLGYFIPGFYLASGVLYMDYLFLDTKTTSFILSMKIGDFFLETEHSIIMGLACIIFLYILGQIISVFSNIIIEELPYVNSVKKMFCIILGEKKYHRNYNLYLIDEGFTDNPHCLNCLLALPKLIKNLFFWLLPIFPPLCFFVAFFSPLYTSDDENENLPILNNLFRAQSLSNEAVSLALKNIEIIINKIGGKYDIKDINSYFHYVYHFVLENSSAHHAKINNYVALYGFMRNMLMSNIVLFYFAFAYLLTKTHTFQSIPTFIFWILNIIFLYGYIKFSRRYTEEVIFAASCLCNSSPQAPKES